MAEMDEEIMKAACSGDVDFLKGAIASKPTNYLLTTFTPINQDTPIAGNIFHLATAHYKEAFVRESIQLLSVSTLDYLLSQQVSYGPLLNWNPLHLAAFMGSHYIVDYILNFYKSTDLFSSTTKPWLARASNGETPLHVALSSKNEHCARQILMFDRETLCSMDDDDGNGPLFLAVLAKFNNLAQEIVESSPSYSVSGKDGFTPLHVLQGFDTDEVLEKLVNEHPELLQKSDWKSKFSALHTWAKEDKANLLGTLGRVGISCFRNLNSLTDYKKNTPMHVALLHGHEYLATELMQHDKNPLESRILPPPAWLLKNEDGNTPFQLALNVARSEMFVHDTIIKDPRICYECNSVGESTLFLAVLKGMDIVVQQILQLPDFHLTRSVPQRHTDGQTVLHVASNCKEETGKLLVRKYRWLINVCDKNGRRPIDVALEVGTSWLVKLLLTIDSSSISHPTTSWNKACAKGHLEAIVSFTKCCPNLLNLCSEQKDSPLHHIKLKGYKEYHEILGIPLIQEMMNLRDSYGRTPLHKALDRRDKVFAEVLLSTKGIEQNMKDKDNKTAIDLLRQLSEKDDEWGSMCKRIGLNPHINAKYIKDPSAMGDVRNTLLVVAAFLAALTFTAGFTLPGGLNQNTGEANLVNKASFIVFVIADTYAMSFAMLVMFSLIWSMVCDHDKALILIDRSVVTLMQSLYGTLVAFMTGVYTVIHNNSLWASVLIFVMCSIVAISSNRTILYFMIDKLFPLHKKKRRRDQSQSIQCMNNDQTQSFNQLYVEEEASVTVNRQSCTSKGHRYMDHVTAAIGAQRMAYHARLAAEYAPPVVDYSDDDLLSTV